jgi:hypothetical protein
MRRLVIGLFLTSIAVLFAAPGIYAELVNAELKGKAPLGCQAGQIWDLPRGECWSCPADYNRSLYPVTSDRACSEAVAERLTKATLHHKTGCAGPEFFDPRNGGECWQCPAGRPRRTAYPVTDARACATQELFGEKLSPATFKGKVGKCTGSQFFDLRNGGECWSCPVSEPRRTLHPVTDARACASKEIVSENLSKATLLGKSSVPFECPKGQYWDPRNRGECWTCPKSHPHRTINPVYQDKACTDIVGEIFVPDPKLICQAAVAGLAAAYKGAKQAQDELAKVLAIANDAFARELGRLEQDLGTLRNTITSATQLDKLFSEVAAKVRGEPFDLALRTAEALHSQSDKIFAVLLDEKLMCDSSQASTVAARLRSVAPSARTRPPSLADLLVSTAHAQARTPLSPTDERLMWSWSLSAGGTLNSPPAGGSVGLSLMTDYGRMHGLYVSFGPQLSTSRSNAGVSLSVMVFPRTIIGKLDRTAAAPTIQVSLGPGEKLEKFLKDHVKPAKHKLAPLPSLDIALDMTNVAFNSGPPSAGVGWSANWDVTKMFGHDGQGLKYVDATGSVSWSIPVWLHLPGKCCWLPRAW